MRKRPLLSVVVPTRNEAESLPLLVERVLAALPGIDVELVVVDDSDDATPQVLQRLAERHPGVVRPHLRSGEERAGGLSTAVVTGLRLGSGRYLCVMDADLQHPPETIAAMLAAAEAGADLVVASRHAPGGSTSGLDGRVRRLVSRAATALARLTFAEARRSRDPLSGFFLCRRALVDGVEFRPVGFKILLELLVLLPDARVIDVPLRFAPRAQGASKASVGQGLLFLRHLRSLVLHVQGSARVWKFALVGASGLGVFLPLLWLLSGPAGLRPVVAFLPAFGLSLVWNTTLNRLWTFADRRRRSGGDRGIGYLASALAGGLLMFGSFAALVALGWPPVAAGALSTVVAALVNAVANRRAVGRPPASWARVAADRGVAAVLEELAEQLGAGRAYLVPADGRPAEAGALPDGLLRRAIDERRALSYTEAPSYRPQRRTNIELRSLLVVPVVRDGVVMAALVCERFAPRGFDGAALETAAHAVDQLSQLDSDADAPSRAAATTGG